MFGTINQNIDIQLQKTKTFFFLLTFSKRSFKIYEILQKS